MLNNKVIITLNRQNNPIAITWKRGHAKMRFDIEHQATNIKIDPPTMKKRYNFAMTFEGGNFCLLNTEVLYEKSRNV